MQAPLIVKNGTPKRAVLCTRIMASCYGDGISRTIRAVMKISVSVSLRATFFETNKGPISGIVCRKGTFLVLSSSARRRNPPMMTAVVALLTGLFVGLIFRLMQLPVPAPAVFEGVLGVVGLWLGYQSATFLVLHWPAFWRAIGLG